MDFVVAQPWCCWLRAEAVRSWTHEKFLFPFIESSHSLWTLHFSQIAVNIWLITFSIDQNYSRTIALWFCALAPAVDRCTLGQSVNNKTVGVGWERKHVQRRPRMSREIREKLQGRCAKATVEQHEDTFADRKTLNLCKNFEHGNCFSSGTFRWSTIVAHIVRLAPFRYDLVNNAAYGQKTNQVAEQLTNEGERRQCRSSGTRNQMLSTSCDSRLRKRDHCFSSK